MRSRGVIVVIALAAACSTVDSRIRRHQAAFDASTPEVRKQIRAGQVAVGFTSEQAAMALGRPGQITTRQTATATQEIWTYGDYARPRVGLDFGMGFGGPGFFGLGTSVAGEPRVAPRLRVVLENGVVVSVESSR